MFERFSEQARRALDAALEAARDAGSLEIRPEHILVGLLSIDGGALRIVGSFSADPERIRRGAASRWKPEPRSKLPSQLPFAPASKDVLERALSEAQSLAHDSIGTSDLLLGLLRVEGTAKEDLLAAGIDLERARLRYSPEEPAAGRPSGPWGGLNPVMGLARREAQRFHHDYIGSEHVLLGALQEGSGVAAGILRSLGADVGRIRRDVEDRITFGSASVTMGQLPFTPGMKRVLELALEQSERLGFDRIGSEHLLLGLILEEKGIPATVLRSAGVTFEAARDAVLDRDRGRSWPSSP